MDEIEKTYIALIKEYAKIKDYQLSKETLKKYHQACKEIELKMTSKQIIQCVYDAFHALFYLAIADAIAIIVGVLIYLKQNKEILKI